MSCCALRHASLPLAPAEVLTGHDRAAGRHGGENVDHQRADAVHERHRRDRRIAHGRDHQRVRKTHRDAEQLLGQHRQKSGSRADGW